MQALDILDAFSRPREQLEAWVSALEGVTDAHAFANSTAAWLAMAQLLPAGSRVLVDRALGPVELPTFTGLHFEQIDTVSLQLTDAVYRGVSALWAQVLSPAQVQSARSLGVLLIRDVTYRPASGLQWADVLFYQHAMVLSGQHNMPLSLWLGASPQQAQVLEQQRIAPDTLACLLTLAGASSLTLRLERMQTNADALTAALATLGWQRWPDSAIFEASLAHNVQIPELPQGVLGAPLTSSLHTQTHAYLSVGVEPLVQLEQLILTPTTVITPAEQLAETTDLIELQPAVVQGFEPAQQDPSAQLSGVALHRYRDLREWRNETARIQKISRFIIASNAVLAAIAQQRPCTLAELQTVAAFSAEQLSSYGAHILEVLGEN